MSDSGGIGTPLRLLIVLPSWVGDAVMATPALALLREALPGTLIGAIARPGIDELLANASVNGRAFIDEFHVGRASGMMGHKHLAAKIRPRMYEAAILLTNSFSTALTVRLAGVAIRVGYDRDARGLLLTHRLHPPKAGLGGFAIISAVDYYWRLCEHALSRPLAPERDVLERTRAGVLSLPEGNPMRLGVSDEDNERADTILARGGIGPGQRFCVLNPGGNNPAKRWPVERFALLADVLADERHLAIAINGSPGELELCRQIARACRVASPAVLPEVALPDGMSIGTLKAIVRRASLMVTNDTGPRHIAAAFGVPLVSLFGPTDHRWTLIPKAPGTTGEQVVVADPSLPEGEEANAHPERCAIEKIELGRVLAAVERALWGRTRVDAG